jgi:HEAT repeat protein
MRPKHNFLDWKKLGYHAFPIGPDTPGYVSAEDAALWDEFSGILAQARAGEFTRLPEIITLYDDSESWLISAAYICLLGDAGDTALMKTVMDITKAVEDPDYVVDMCRVLASWGSLSAVPLMLESWVNLEGYDDREDIALGLSELLEPEPGPIAKPGDDMDGEAYSALVAQACARIREVHGADTDIVLRGEPLWMRGLAMRMLGDLATGQLDPVWRHKFEAGTGIDCKAFFDDGRPNPLEAAAVLERFLEDPRSSGFETGARYFFGNRLR